MPDCSLAKSNRSFTSSSMRSAPLTILVMWLSCSAFSGPDTPSSRMLAKPMMKFSGVRSSWLMTLRNSSL
ncbi:hypothetical protein D3C72_1431860 [compost metagenome]